MKPILTLSLIVIPVTISSALFAQERIVSRDATEYDLGNGMKRLVIQRGQNYFKNGSWRKYDFSIRNETSGGYDRKIENDFIFRFSAGAGAGYRIEKDGHYVAWELMGANAVSSAADGRTIRYSGIKNQADIEFQAAPDGVKETIILKAWGAPASFQFRLLSDLDISSDSLEVLFSSNGEPLFRMPPVFALDSLKNALPAGFTIFQKDGNHFFEISVDTANAVSPSGLILPLR